MNRLKLIIFTDLDGTLLDHFTYAWDEAQPALNKLFLLQIPVIPCTSKTEDESVYYRGQLGLEHPFIIENGAAVYAPLGYFVFPISDAVTGGYEVMQFGIPYSNLRLVLENCRKELKLNLAGFGDLDPEQISELTGLPDHLAELAVRRKYNEPFYFLDEASEQKLDEMKTFVAKDHLKITKGGRFYHLTGDHDKGLAVKALIEAFRQNQEAPVISIGIGDSVNDLPMLRQVDIPCLVKNGRQEYDPDIMEQLSPRLAEGSGPTGWNVVVQAILNEYDLKP